VNGLSRIRQIDYTIIFCRDLEAMKHFYGEVLGFPHDRSLSPTWIEYRIGSNILALTQPGGLFHDPPPPHGALSLQLAFRVAPDEVHHCAAELEAKGVALEMPVTDQPWKHRTLFFRDPDGNVLEIYADI
jgi:lactoylglutathione lyase